MTSLFGYARFALGATALFVVCMLTGPLEHLQPRGRRQGTPQAKYEVVVSYNCCSLAQGSRLQDIHEELSHASVICMQGTRRRQVGNQPLAFHETEKFWHIDAGYPSRGNRHTGVSISLAKRSHRREDLHSMAFPVKGALVG